ncbi:Squalene synthase [hydrothermal vent metagenome]|uniref:Squalene synthase n=1 Tax=hydrothermal vent metagenome TaxID=652676 RepID=A0A3B0XPP8_9ZZZZ
MNTRQAYKHCLDISRNHYENFPVASWLLPKTMRLPTAAIYAFARLADDIADEGDLSDEQRFRELDQLNLQIKQMFNGETSEEPIFIALSDCVQSFNLPQQLFEDLIDAFKQDINKKRYTDFAELMQYCRRSANPVGRLMLHLYGQTDRKSLGQSDAVCSALQLINFYQDLSQDYKELGRIYIPQDEMLAAGVNENHFERQLSNGPMLTLMRKQYQRAHKLLQSGAPLGKTLKGRFGFEIRLIIAGGSRILLKLDKQTDDVFSRPRLNFNDWLWVFWKALRAR